MAWKKVQVGDVVQVSMSWRPIAYQQLVADEIIPADLLMLATSAPEGVCFVETANLDGETNLKQRRLFYEVRLQFMSTF